MATPRNKVVSKDSVGIYHCISRCVRRAFLCGKDPYTGKTYTHRRHWIKNNINDLAQHFYLKVIASTVQSNHMHIIIKLDPFATVRISPDEVVRRWRRIFPYQRDSLGKPLELTDDQYLRDIADTYMVQVWRERLVDLGWFMRCAKEPVARRSNKEDNCTGHFWEGRFKAIRIEDDAALLACMAYVDLNSVRAGEVDRPEYCNYSGIRDRVEAYRARRQLELAEQYREAMENDKDARIMMAWALRQAKSDQWLCPLDEIFEGWNGYEGGIEEEHYLELVDWTGRKLRNKDAGHIPPHLAGILERMDVDLENWASAVEKYGGLFAVFAGKARRIRKAAVRMGRKWAWGVNLKVSLYRQGA